MSFLNAYFIEKLKKAISPYFVSILESIPHDDLQKVVQSNSLLLPLFSSSTQDKIMAQLRPYSDYLLNIDNDSLVALIMELVEEQKPDFKFITRQWLTRNIDNLKTLL